VIRGVAVLLLALATSAAGRDTVDVSDEAVRQSIDRGIAYLLESQREDGYWGGVRNATFTSRFADPGTYDSWTYATTALATLALLELGEGEKAAAAVEGGLDWLVAHADLKRPAEWDVDNVWGLVYGLHTLARVVTHERYRDSDRADELREAAQTVIRGLQRFQSPRGGWGYYANPIAAWLPEWATSFTTAAGVIALHEAREAGLQVPDKVYRAAVRAVRHSRLPSGAYSYSIEAIPRHMRMESIDQIKGALGRIQVGNYALHVAGVELPKGELERGMELFFRYHRFLDVARNKPIPHEAYYAVAAYFYLFGHYYAAHVLELLPEESRARYAPMLRREILKCQQEDGAFWDFWIASTTKPYGTSFAILALARTLED
jgi:hypothetical protein